jgi:hypothetical protein
MMSFVDTVDEGLLLQHEKFITSLCWVFCFVMCGLPVALRPAVPLGSWLWAPILDKIDQKNYVIFWSGRYLTGYIANGVQITDYRYDIFRKNQTGRKASICSLLTKEAAEGRALHPLISYTDYTLKQLEKGNLRNLRTYTNSNL